MFQFGHDSFTLRYSTKTEVKKCNTLIINIIFTPFYSTLFYIILRVSEFSDRHYTRYVPILA
jgi:hypothetical protein